MDQALAIRTNGNVGTGRSETPVATRLRAAQERVLRAIALPLDVHEGPAGAFALDDTFVPVRWKF